MDSTTTFSCRIGTTDPAATLGLEIWFDNQQILNVEHVQHNMDVAHNFNDQEGQQQLRFILKNKTFEHTKIGKNGEILKDACLTISNVTFEEIELGHVFTEQTTYTHDFNGTQAEIIDQFYGSMGCNGTVTLKFSTPIYLWLLEHM